MKSMSGFGGGVASLMMKTAAGGGGIVTNNLVLHLDAGNSSSYSGSGTTWTDLSGQSNNGTLVGGTGYSSDDGGVLVFDGTDDYVVTGSDMFNANADFTVSIWLFMDDNSVQRAFIADVDNSQSLFLRYNNGIQVVNSNTAVLGSFSSSTLLTNTWYNITLTRSSNTYTLYVNGNSVSSLYGISQNFTHSPTTIGANNNNSPPPAYKNAFDGKIAQVFAYNTALSDSDVQQNFDATKSRYTGVITDNLVLNLDAGDSSSYSGSGNTWTDLSSSNNDGTINGATYNSGNGGYFDFDGSNDSISFTLSNDFAFGTGDFTIEAWVRFAAVGDGGTISETRENAVGNPARQGLGFGMRSNRITIWSGVTNTFIIDKTLSLPINAWHHVIVSRSSGTLKSYINTVEETSSSNTHNFTRRNLFIGRNINDSSTGGTTWGNQDQALLRIYKGKGFSAADVQRNFDATKSRYTGLVTDNLVLNLDAGDSNSYSGSGTTWTDLSEQGNHATLINNPTYSSNNEGYLNFDGINDYATLPNMDLTGNEITFSIWTYATSTDSNSSLIFLGDSTAPHGNGRIIQVHLPYSGNYYFDKGHDGSSSASYDRINGSLPNSDWQSAWVNWSFTANASTGSMKIYRNGSLYASGTGKTKTFSDSDGDMKYIGYNGKDTKRSKPSASNRWSIGGSIGYGNNTKNMPGNQNK